jgi:hypothetical protein
MLVVLAVVLITAQAVRLHPQVKEMLVVLATVTTAAVAVAQVRLVEEMAVLVVLELRLQLLGHP